MLRQHVANDARIRGDFHIALPRGHSHAVVHRYLEPIPHVTSSVLPSATCIPAKDVPSRPESLRSGATFRAGLPTNDRARAILRRAPSLLARQLQNCQLRELLSRSWRQPSDLPSQACPELAAEIGRLQVSTRKFRTSSAACTIRRATVNTIASRQRNLLATGARW